MIHPLPRTCIAHHRNPTVKPRATSAVAHQSKRDLYSGSHKWLHQRAQTEIIKCYRLQSRNIIKESIWSHLDESGDSTIHNNINSTLQCLTISIANIERRLSTSLSAPTHKAILIQFKPLLTGFLRGRKTSQPNLHESSYKFQTTASSLPSSSHSVLQGYSQPVHEGKLEI
jgi:hypothetical protein